jgi:multicomponent Na+:H+ antiporter subunit A
VAAARAGALVSAALALWLASFLPAPEPALAPGFRLAWLPELGVVLAFRLDGLALLMALLVAAIGALVLLYTGSYLRGDPLLGRLVLLLALFELAMLGLVLADDLVTLFVFWELTTLTSYLLVGHRHDDAEARRAALQALLVTGAGGLALLAAILLLGGIGQTLAIVELNARGEAIRADPLYPVVLGLLLLACFTKSAQFPFHFWLPGAMAAPTPVSAYLHSATMVKAGVFLLARLHPALGGTELWFWALAPVGALTAVWASAMALVETDLKLVLAWTTVMALGTLTMLLGADQPAAIVAAVSFLVVHALYKCALFLVVGAIDHATGTREIDRLGGLARAMPATALAALLAGFSMAGFPPFLGFIGKELKYEGALAMGELPLAFAGAAVLANAMMVSVAGMLSVRAFFWWRAPATPRRPHEAPPGMLVGPLVLAALGLVLGLLPETLEDALLEPAAAAVLARPVPIALKLWHGVNLPLVLSLVTVCLGTLLFVVKLRVRAALGALARALPIDGERAFEAGLGALRRLAAAQTRLLQSGRLARYLGITFATAALAATPLLRAGPPWPAVGPLEPVALAAVLVMAAATLVVVLSPSRLLAICALGLVGVGLAVLFLLYGAIDVAITQALVETLFVVIIATLLPRLPPFTGRAHPGTAGRLRDLALATAVGGTVALLTLAVVSRPVDRRVTAYYERTAVPEAHGRNVVNVILVDFRALDTLGEITVVLVAGLAVLALVGARRSRRGEAGR